MIRDAPPCGGEGGICSIFREGEARAEAYVSSEKAVYCLGSARPATRGGRGEGCGEEFEESVRVSLPRGQAKV